MAADFDDGSNHYKGMAVDLPDLIFDIRQFAVCHDTEHRILREPHHFGLYVAHGNAAVRFMEHPLPDRFMPKQNGVGRIYDTTILLLGKP